MGDPLREDAFDVAYDVLGDVGEAEDCANVVMARAGRRWGTVEDDPDREAWVVSEAATVAMAKIRKSGRQLVALGTAASVLFALAAAVAVARNGGTTGAVQTAAASPTVAGAEQPTTTEASTSTTVVLVQPPPGTLPAPANTPMTTAPVRRVSPTTTEVAPARPKAPAEANATLAQVWPPNGDPARLYVSARGRDPASYVSQMAIDWGDGTAATNFDYPLASCQTGVLQAANANHAYAAPGTYTLQLFVTSVACDGTGARLAAVQTTVAYPSSPPAG